MAWSNADSVNVRIGVIPGSVSLVSSDSALQGQKVGYAFSVSVTENPEWAFLGWDAVREADYYAYRAGNRSLAANAASYAAISDALDGDGNKTGAASVTAYTSEPFYLVPYCVERPRVTDHNLKGFTDRQVTNYPIQIWFSRPLEPGTVTFDNFILSAQTNQGYGGTMLLEGTGFTSYYEEPEINGSIVTIRRRKQSESLEADFKKLNITLTLREDSICDTDGIYMGKSGDFTELRYGVRTDSYTFPPGMVDVVEMALVSNALSSEPDNYLQKTEAGKYVVYLLLDQTELNGSVDRDYTELDTIRVTEKNTSLSYPQGERDYLYAIYSDDFESSSGYTDLVNAYKASHNNEEPYILRHEILNRVDGEIQIAIQPIDALGNRYTFAELETAGKIVTVKLDTTPPGQVGISPSYNQDNDTLTLDWTNPAVDDLDSVELSWTKNNSSQSFLSSIPQNSGGAVTLSFPDIEEGNVCVFTITATDKAGNESQTTISVDTSDRTPPGPVTGLNLSYDGALKTISLGWTNPGDADLKEARVAWGIEDQPQKTVVVPAAPGAGGSRQFTLTAADIKTTNTYVFKVQTADNSGNVSTSPVSREITLACAPAGLTAVGTSSNSITLSWNPVSEASGYRVYRSAGAAGAYTLAGTSTAASYTLSGLSPETKCYFKVAALLDLTGGLIEGSHSDSVYGITLPSVPAGVRAETASLTSIKVSWDEVTGALEYKVYRSTVPDSAYSLVTALAAPAGEYTDTGLLPGTIYYYKVSVRTSGGESDLPAYAPAATAPDVPDAPVSLVISAVSSTSISLSWASVSGAASYKIYRSASATGVYAEVGTSTAAPFTNTGLTPHTTYYYKVSAVNSSNGEGPLSAYAPVTTEVASENSAITLTITDEGDGAFSQGTFTVSKSNNGHPQTQTVTLTGTGYANLRWYVDGFLTGSGASITINAADYGKGGHSLSLWVDKNSKSWSKEIDFTVAE